MKTILLPFQDDDAAETALDAAVLIAKRFNSHVEGLFVLPQPQIIAGEGIALPGVYLTQMAEDGRKLADAAKARFSKCMAKHDIELTEPEGKRAVTSAGWREVEGLESQIVGDHGRLFDIVVVGRTTKYYAGDWNIICEAILFESGRPVLVSGNTTPERIGKNVVVAWNCSTETARTLALGLSLFSEAEKVTVVTIDGETVPGPSGEDLAKYLRYHGLEVEAKTVEPGGRSSGDALLEESRALGADLIVKGAYTHTRLRQMIFGGYTRHLLTHAEIPMLMAH